MIPPQLNTDNQYLIIIPFFLNSCSIYEKETAKSSFYCIIYPLFLFIFFFHEPKKFLYSEQYKVKKVAYNPIP